MSLQEDIGAYLKRTLFEAHEPFCFCVDAEYRLTDSFGNAATYGFDSLQPGADTLQAAPFLLGMLQADVVVVPFATLPGAGTVEIHIVPRAADHAVLILASSAGHAAWQERQQAANENRLLQVEQQRLIRRQRDLIADLVEARSQLESQRQKAIEANEAKGRFIAMMSHEFRTPLASIIGYAERLGEGDTDEEARASDGKAIARAARHLSELVNDVLDEARLDAGRQTLNLRAVDIRSVIDDLAAIIAPLAGEKALAFVAQVSPDVPSHLELDDGCLRQVLLNLLGNAVKYTDDGGIRIGVDWSDNELRTIVADDGPGIAAADQQRMFMAFERGAAKASLVTGSGLGLSISLRLTALMNGTLSMDSDIGKGCRITVSVPAQIIDAGAMEQSLAPPQQALQTDRPALILISDDDEDMRLLHDYYLTRAGYELLLVGDGKTALELALGREPDLVILDINTPGMNGIDVARQLRAAGCGAPIVALTASDASRLDPGLFDARLRKPLQMERLLQAVRELLSPSE
ncbi:MAG: ATP-binding protein [Woeseia sp.]